MQSELKVIIHLAYDRKLVLEPTRENILIALQLAESKVYDDKWDDETGKVSYMLKHDTIGVEVKQVLVSDVPPKDD